jgi:hypothetical protein
MKGCGRITCTTAEESFITQVEISTKVNFMMIWHKGLGFISMRMEASTLDIGTKTNSMDLEKRNGMTRVCIKASTKTPVKKDKENINGLMEIGTSGNGVRICLTEKAFSSGMTIVCILETGRII